MTDAATVEGLVSIYSPSGQERAAADWLTERMKTLGCSRAFVDEVGNAVGIWGGGPRQIVLMGHIDTVPGELPVKVEDGFLYGRGAVDAKGALACFVDAAAALGVVEDWQVVVIGAVEEERDSNGALFAAQQYTPEFTVVGEPNHWNRVALGYKGSAWAKLTVRCGQTHTAHEAESACEMAVADWLKVKAFAAEFNAGREKAFDSLLVTLREMASGTDALEQWASLRVGARLPLDVSPQDWFARLTEITPDALIEPMGTPIGAWKCDKNTPLIRAMLGSIRAAGGTPSFVYKTGTADLNIVAPRWGCPAVVYGPGDSALDHTPDERLSLEEYGQAVHVLAAALRSLVSK